MICLKLHGSQPTFKAELCYIVSAAEREVKSANRRWERVASYEAQCSAQKKNRKYPINHRFCHLIILIGSLATILRSSSSNTYSYVLVRSQCQPLKCNSGMQCAVITATRFDIRKDFMINYKMNAWPSYFSRAEAVSERSCPFQTGRGPGRPHYNSAIFERG